MNRQDILEQAQGPMDIASLNTSTVHAVCPICSKEVEIQTGGELVARAWITGHILEIHEDELPPLSGNGQKEEQ